MSKIFWPGGALLAPVPPVLVTCQAGEVRNVVTVGWTGILSTKPPKTYISLRPSRYSYDLIRQSGSFVINLPTTALARQVDLCGVKSGREVDKLALCGFEMQEAGSVAGFSLAACPVSLECRVTDLRPQGSHDVLEADIVAVGVEEALLDAKGRLMIERCNLLCYAHGTYFSLGKAVGTFGFSVKKRSSKGGRGRSAENRKR